ncbi:hypothetical protein LTS10_013215 [Elasticomyces elasticus]|nr:hypothetical protein LTS10_013215 [Elasticomyces elasticus]
MAPKPCIHFQSNNCRKGKKCAYTYVIDSNFKRKACTHFANGKCRFGDQCTYSHAPEDIALLKATLGSSGTETRHGKSVSTETQFKEWRYNIPLPDRVATARPLGPARTKFCQQALELVDGEAGVMQEVVTLLASEGGCLRVRELAAQDFAQLPPKQYTRIFEAQLLPFFKVITHKNVDSSLILTKRLMTLYNIVYGENGDRAVRLFTAAAEHLSAMSLMKFGDVETVDQSNAEAIETTLAVMDKLVEVNTNAMVHDELKAVVATIRTIFDQPLPASAAFAFKPALRYLRRIEQRLGLGQNIPHTENVTKTTGGRAFFELACERPGELSDDGPRHDNDHVDIRQISILPSLQEIQSPRVEYLPLADPREWHIGGLRGLLDRHFRLLREHTRTVASVKAHALVYCNVAVSNLAFDSYSGMEFALSFDQPRELQGKSERQRHDWWDGSKRLGHEVLICLLSSEGCAKFFIVSPAPLRPKKDFETGAPIEPLHKTYNLWSEEERAHVIAKLVNQPDMYSLLDQLMGGFTEQLSLVEFPGALLPAFKPTLQAMQTMSNTLDMPFLEVLAPTSVTADSNQAMGLGPPNYATKPGFRYNLSAVTKSGKQLHLNPARNTELMTAELTSHSTLDYGQAHAVVSSLSRSLALIQGPPGTGKSYTGVQLIKILLDNKKASDLGPIICVCYTNHALDQGLERLVDEGVQNVVRIGGSSKSERLADVNLRAVVQRLDLTKTEKSDRYELTKKLEMEAKEINSILSQMGQLGSETSLSAYLLAFYPEMHTQLFGGVDQDGWQTVDYNRDGILEKWIVAAHWGNGRPRTLNVLRDVPITHMTGQERRIMHAAWIGDMREELQDKLHTAIDGYNKLKKQLDAIRSELELRVRRQANIVGITTSGLARHLDLIRRTGAKVILCEEAGEVLESHLLTALLPSVEHAILIGDHQQLRPQVQNYSLSCESKNGAQYALDVSLFERLVQPQDALAQSLPYCTLTVQRRMHPQISQLVRRTLYPLLQDAPALDRPPVVGMRDRLFWLDHKHRENQDGDAAISDSRTNDHEVNIVAALVKHLVHQGVYTSEDIAVITPYLGQLRKISAKLSSTFNIVLNDRDEVDLHKEGIDNFGDDTAPAGPVRHTSVVRGSLLQAIRVATIDNFQGEEAKVVVVSLVRSNAKNNPGFLKTSNRINVLLSRAKNGMYIIGNGDTMSQVEMWADVIQISKQDHCFGPTLQLCCPRHEDTPLRVAIPEDFLRLIPEAGCARSFEKQLSCGHACVSKCHSDLLHEAVHCMKACTRPKAGCTHNCRKPCGDPCDPVCLETVEDINIELECGHQQASLPCYQHQDLSKVLCDVEVEKTVPGCTHKKKRTEQSGSSTVNASSPAIAATPLVPTGTRLLATAKSHAAYVQPNARFVARTPYAERNVTRPAPLVLSRYAARTALTQLNCGSDDVRATQADMVMFEPYGDIDLNEDPCIFTACAHIFTLSSMDGIMSMVDHYDIDPMSGKIVGLKSSSEPFSSHELKACPTCRGSLRNLARYGRIVRRALLDDSAKKLTVWSNRTYADLAEHLSADEAQLSASIDAFLKPHQNVTLHDRPSDQLKAVKSLKTSQRYRKAFATRSAVQSFADKLRKDEQPYQRVRNLVETVRREHAEDGIMEFSFASSELQLRERLQAISLLIRCDIIIFSDVTNVHVKTTAGRARGDLHLDFANNRSRCDGLVKESEETYSVRQEVEGRLFWARFVALECGAFDSTREDVPPGATA